MLGLRFCARAFSSCGEQPHCHSSSRCAGLSLSRPLLLRSTGSRRTGSVVVAHGPSRSAACGILPDQGSNPCPLRWQADSQPLHHQGSPESFLYFRISDTLRKITSLSAIAPLPFLPSNYYSVVISAACFLSLVALFSPTTTIFLFILVLHTRMPVC